MEPARRPGRPRGARHRGVPPAGLPRRLRRSAPTAAPTPAPGSPAHGWRGWWRIGTAVFPQGAMISAVSRSQDKLDIFATDVGGSGADRGLGAGVRRRLARLVGLNGGRARPGAPVTAVSPQPGQARHVRHRHRRRLLHGRLGAGLHRLVARLVAHRRRRRSRRARTIGAVSRSQDKLDIFATDIGGRGRSARPGSRRSPTAGTAGGTSSAAWARPGAPVTAVSRSARQARHLRDRHRQRDLHGGLGAGVRRRLARLVEPERRHGRPRVADHRASAAGRTSSTCS